MPTIEHASNTLIAQGVQAFSPAASGTVTIDCTAGNLVVVTLPAAGGGVLILQPVTPTVGQAINVVFLQGAVATLVTFNSAFKFANGNSTISPTANSISMLSMVYSSGGYWLASLGTNFV